MFVDNKNKLQLNIFGTINNTNQQKKGKENETRNKEKAQSTNRSTSRDNGVLGEVGRQRPTDTSSGEKSPNNESKVVGLDRRDKSPRDNSNNAGSEKRYRHVSFGGKEELISFCQERRYSSSTTSIARLKSLKERDLKPSFDDLKDLFFLSNLLSNLANIFTNNKHKKEKGFLKPLTTKIKYN